MFRVYVNKTFRLIAKPSRKHFGKALLDNSTQTDSRRLDLNHSFYYLHSLNDSNNFWEDCPRFRLKNEIIVRLACSILVESYIYGFETACRIFNFPDKWHWHSTSSLRWIICAGSISKEIFFWFSLIAYATSTNLGDPSTVLINEIFRLK